MTGKSAGDLAPGRMEEIEKRIRGPIPVKHLQVLDESHQHVGHAGARDGRGHFQVVVESDVFDGKSMIQRHRMIYQAMGDLMQTDIHALTIDAKTTDKN